MGVPDQRKCVCVCEGGGEVKNLVFSRLPESTKAQYHPLLEQYRFKEQKKNKSEIKIPPDITATL